MKILAIETSTLTGSIALLSDGALLGETTLSVSAQHSERLMPAIEQLLQNAAVDIADVDLFAVANGPGSFTGLRIGIAAAQGLALAHGKAVVGVSTLEGLAMNAVYFQGIVVPVLNAFRGEVYWRFNNEDRVSGAENMTADLQKTNDPILILGNGIVVCRDVLMKNLGDRLHIAPEWLHHPRAVPVATLAAKRFHEGPSPEPVLPRYLRKPG